MTCLRELDPATLLKPAGAACSSGVECCGGVCSAGRCQTHPCPILYRNGYCTVKGCSFAGTLSDRACPPDSACNRYYEAGLCQRRCDPVQPEDCRGHAADLCGDYECRNWSTLLLRGAPLALDPVCDFGPLVACDALQADGLTCGVFGVDSLGRLNVTHMTCRTLQGAVTTDPFDRDGFCLDDTASGATRRSP